MVGHLKAKLIKRLMAKLDITTTCWNWQAGKDKNGYGKISCSALQQRNMRAHRLAYLLFKGAIPAGLQVMHSCDNPSCCNPQHLSLGTTQDNTKDRDNKGRGIKGSKVGLAKLTEEQVLQIRVEGGTIYEIAAKWGISKSAAAYIKNRTTWKHV